MTHRVVQAFLEDQVELAPDIGAERQIEIRREAAKLEDDVTRGQAVDASA